MNSKNSSDRNLKNSLLRMVRYDKGFSADKVPINRASLQKDTRDDIMDTIEPMRFKGGFITVENKT